MGGKLFDSILDQAKKFKVSLVIPAAENEEVLQSVHDGLEEGIVSEGILIGDGDRIRKIAGEIGLDLGRFEIIQETDYEACSRLAVKFICDGKATVLLKGQVDTKIYMKAILDKSAGLVKEGEILSHCAVMDIPAYHKALVLTDAAIAIEPDLETKKKIVQNSINFCQKLGIERPKIALVCAVEKVNPKMKSTVDAQAIVEAAQKGEITGGIVEGPYDFYIATNRQLAQEKGVKGEVCGDADVVVMHEINGANALYKGWTSFVPGIRNSAIVAGGSNFFILPSRTDPSDTKKYSIAFCGYLMSKQGTGR